MGDGSRDAGRRGARHCIPVQAEADGECEETDRQDVRQGQLGGRRPELAGAGHGTAAQRLEEEAPGCVIKATAAGSCGDGETGQTKQSRAPDEARPARSGALWRAL